tara:strand:+ start:2045 stop:2245 length:201 start_codon:yes stop_codon:yes gene_type:complete
MKAEIKSIQVGDKIICRPITRSGSRKITRTVTAIIHNSNDYPVVCIRLNGWDKFQLKTHEIIEVLR